MSVLEDSVWRHASMIRSWGWKEPRISRPHTRTFWWLKTWQSRERLVSVDWGGTFTAPHRPFHRHGNWISNQCFTLRFMRWSTILLEPSQEYPSGLSKLENAGCMSNAENSHAFLSFSRILWTRCFLQCSEKYFLTGIFHMALKHRTTWKTVNVRFYLETCVLVYTTTWRVRFLSKVVRKDL
jgi:hypothetical protein